MPAYLVEIPEGVIAPLSAGGTRVDLTWAQMAEIIGAARPLKKDPSWAELCNSAPGDTFVVDQARGENGQGH